MPDANQCPQCGTPLPAGALAGLCPACLLKMGAAADTITDAKQNLSRRQAQAKVALVTAELAQRRHRLARVHGSLGRAPGQGSRKRVEAARSRHRADALYPRPAG